MKKPLILLLIILIIPLAHAIQSNSSSFNQTSSVIDLGGGNSSSSSFSSYFSIGQSAVGNSLSNSFQTILGFHQFFNVLPEAPTLTYPPNNNITIDTTPTFNWTVPTDINGDQLHFRIQIANESSFENISVDQTSSSNTTGFSPVPPVPCCSGNQLYTSPVLPFRTHYWRVAALDSNGQGTYSTTFNFTILTSIICTLSNDTIDFGTINSGETINATNNYAGAGDGTKYNITTTSNVDINITNKGENLTCQSVSCSDDFIYVQNITWQSNTTSASGTNMVFTNGIELQPDFDTTNPVAIDFPTDSTVFLRYWLQTRQNQGGGTYNGTYTVKCEQA